MDINYVNKVLKNGLKLLFIPMEKIEIVHIELKILCGWEHENDKTLESAHFLEHMLAKFTSKKYPDGIHNKYQLGKFGIMSNASTMEQMTSYFLEGNTKHIDYMLDLLINSYKEFIIDDAIIEQERKAIIQELKAHKQEMYGDIFETIDKIIYKKTDKEKVSIDDRIKNVKKLTKESIIRFRNKYYSSRSSLLIIAGDFNLDECYSKIKKELNSFDLLDFKPIEFPIIKLKNNKQRTYFIENTKKSNVTLIILFFNKYNYFDKEYLYISAIHEILSSGLSSRLTSILRSQLGLVYYIGSDHTSNMDGVNYELIQTEFDTKHLGTVLTTILEQLDLIKDEYVHDDELEKTVNTVVNSTLRENLIKTPDFVIDRISIPILFNEPNFTLEYKYDILKSIDIDTIKKTAKSIFSKKNMFIFYESPRNLNSQIKKILPNCKFYHIKS
jgi:predicted Zn-dependent peptidase